MRMNSLKKDIISTVELLNFDTEETMSNGTKFVTIKNWATVCTALHKLGNYGFLAEYVQKIFNRGMHYEVPEKSLNLSQSEFLAFKKDCDLVIFSAHLCINIIDEFFQEDAENQLNIKLPDNLTLEQLDAIVGDLNFVLNKCSAIRTANDNNDVKIDKVDSGSIWLIIGVTSAALTLVGKIVHYCLATRRELLNQDMMKQQLRVYKTGADMIQSLEEEMERKLKEQYQNDAKKIISEHGLSNNNEDVVSLKAGMEKLTDMIYKGVEIYASIEAPELSQSAFPSAEAYRILLPDVQKQLAEPADSE